MEHVLVCDTHRLFLEFAKEPISSKLHLSLALLDCHVEAWKSKETTLRHEYLMKHPPLLTPTLFLLSYSI